MTTVVSAGNRAHDRPHGENAPQITSTFFSIAFWAASTARSVVVSIFVQSNKVLRPWGVLKALYVDQKADMLRYDVSVQSVSARLTSNVSCDRDTVIMAPNVLLGSTY